MDFFQKIATKLPAGYHTLPGNPSVEAMLEDLGQTRIYPVYTLLAAYVHASHASTWLYRKHLGTLKEAGEFIAADSWYLPCKVHQMSALVTDGQRLYFQAADRDRIALGEVSVSGGDSALIATPFLNTFLDDIAPDGSSILIGSFEGTNEESPTSHLVATLLSRKSKIEIGNINGTRNSKVV